MSVSFQRGERWVELQTFFNDEVIEYLASKLNVSKRNFRLLVKPKFCNGVMTEFNNVKFIVYAEKSWVELSFDKADAEKMSPVIEEITKWDKF